MFIAVNSQVIRTRGWRVTFGFLANKKTLKHPGYNLLENPYLI